MKTESTAQGNFTPPPDAKFLSELATLCAAFNVPCTEERRTAYRKAFGHLPPLAWERLVAEACAEDGCESMPTVGALWRLQKRLRASAPTPPAPPDPWKGDVWLEAANRHLLGHIMRILKANSQHYGPILSTEMAGHVARIVAAKNAWAADMRDIAEAGEVPVELQRKIWDDYLGKAEADIAASKAQAAA